MRILYLLICSCLLFSNISTAQNPVTWSFSTESISSDEYQITFTAEVADGWSIYSQHTDPSGPIPTSFNFEENANIELVGEVEESGKKKEAFDELFGVNVIKFSGTTVFTQKVKVKTTGISVSGYLEYMCCDDEKCLPPKEVDFEITLQ